MDLRTWRRYGSKNYRTGSCTKIGANKEKYFDGVVKRILDNVSSKDTQVVVGGQCIVSGTTELTDGAAVEAALYAMWKKCPKQIRKKTSLAFCGRMGCLGRV